MAHPKQQDSIRYVTDIVNLSVTLDEVISRDTSQPITRALSRGKEGYFDLVYRRLSVDFRVGEAPIVLWMLDLIQAQLGAPGTVAASDIAAAIRARWSADWCFRAGRLRAKRTRRADLCRLEVQPHMDGLLDFAGFCVIAIVFTLLTLLIRDAGRHDP